MFIYGKQEANDIMAVFFEALKTGTDRAFDFKIKSIVKDVKSGFLECVFEEVDKLEDSIKNTIPESYTALHHARNAYTSSPLSDRVATDNFQKAIYAVLQEDNPNIDLTKLSSNF